MNQLHRDGDKTALQSRKKEVWQRICQLTFSESWQYEPKIVAQVQALNEELNFLYLELKKSETKKLPRLSVDDLDLEHYLNLRSQGYKDREINKIFCVSQANLSKWKKQMGLTRSEVTRCIDIIEAKEM